MTHKERVLATIRGEWLDKPCYSGFGPHYSLEERNARDLAEAMIGFQKYHDFDFIKVQCNGMYIPEAFGQYIEPTSDMNFQAWETVNRVINTPKQWRKITPKQVLPDNALGREVEVIKRINDYFQGDVPIIATTFSPFIWMGEMAGGYFREEMIVDMFREYEADCRVGLEVMEETCTRVMEAFLDAGASGFFYGVQGCMAEKMGREMFDEFEKAPSLRCLNAVKDKSYFTLLHICSLQSERDKGFYEDWFLDYPVEAINWADVHKGTRSMGEMREVSDKVLVGGLNHFDESQGHHHLGHRITDFTGIDRAAIKRRIKARVRAAIEQAGNKLMISGGCGFDFNSHHRFGVWHEVMEEIAEERAASRK